MSDNTDDLARGFLCGAYSQPRPVLPYRCTRPAGHAGRHFAVIDGVKVAVWSRLDEWHPAPPEVTG